jgi:tetratricopeptide (TPR) repeat protein
MSLKISYPAIILLIFLLNGCAAVGVPTTSDPLEKLVWSQELLYRQDRPLPAERLIIEAIEIYTEEKDTECSAEAYSTYGSFLVSSSVKKRKKKYQKRGFLDKTVTYEERLSKAIEYYDKSIALKPDSTVYHLLGLTYFDKGQYNQTIVNLDKAIDLKPNYEDAFATRANAYNNMGQYDQAFADYDKVISLNPNNSLNYNNRGSAYSKIGQYDRAIADFDKAISIKSKFALAYSNRAFSHFFFLGQFNKAAKDYEHVSNLYPKNVYFVLNFYLATQRQGKNEEKELLSRLRSLQIKGMQLNIWPTPLANLFLGKTTPNEVLENFSSFDFSLFDEDEENIPQSESFFYIGQYHLLRGNKEQAMLFFKRTIELGLVEDASYKGAKAELNRL